MQGIPQGQLHVSEHKSPRTHGDPWRSTGTKKRKQSWPLVLHPCHLARIHVCKYSCVWERLEQEETIQGARLGRNRRLAQGNIALAMREYENLRRMGELR